MIVIVGCIVVVGAVLAGFTWAGGHIGALIHPSEIVTIGGASLGALIVMSPKKVLVDLFKGVIQAIKGSPFTKAMYGDLFRLMYDLLRTARREGLLGLEVHVAHPHESSIFTKYPRVANNHHVCDFICSGLTPLVEGTARKEQLPALFAADLAVIEEEHHIPTHALQTTADGLPGFGIVDGTHRRSASRDRPQSRRRARRYLSRNFDVLRVRRSLGGSDGIARLGRNLIFSHDCDDHHRLR